MASFKRDPDTGERIREGGAFVRVSGEEEIVQNVTIRFRLIRGEAVFARSKGVRYFDHEGVPGLTSKGFPAESMGGEFRGEALDVPGLVQIDELELEQTDEQRAARVASITWSGTGSVEDARQRIAVRGTATVNTGAI